MLAQLLGCISEGLCSGAVKLSLIAFLRLLLLPLADLSLVQVHSFTLSYEFTFLHRIRWLHIFEQFVTCRKLHS